MDPEANMKRQIDLAREIIAEADEEYARDDYDQARAGEELAELVLALAEWKKKGGAV